MATITAGDFRNGKTFRVWTASSCMVVEFQHVKPGKGAAFVRTKMKNVVTGGVTETLVQPDREVRGGVHRAQGSSSTATPTATCTTSWTRRRTTMDPRQRRTCPDNFKFVKENDPCQAAELQGQGLQRRDPELRRADRHRDRPGRQGQHCYQRRSSPLPLRPAPRSRSRCSSTRATTSASIPARASIWAVSRVDPSLQGQANCRKGDFTMTLSEESAYLKGLMEGMSSTPRPTRAS